jgi:hypothetical protein
MTCYEGVTKHKCQLWCHVSGTDAMDQPIDAFGCADILSLKLTHEMSKEVRQSAASTDKVATETKKMRDGMTARDVQMVNAMRANILRLVETGDDKWRRQIGGYAQAGDPSGNGLAGFPHALGVGSPECSDPGDGGLSSQGAERDSSGGEDGNPETA